MKKYLFLAATTALALTSCVSDDYTGENPGGTTGEVAISFGSKTASMTRAGGSAAATLLNNKFVVYGFKTVDDAPVNVFDHYEVNYVDGTGHSTNSNAAGWEYVGYTPNIMSSLAQQPIQDIKYWDYAATQYDFIAFSTAANGQDKTTAAADKVVVTAIQPKTTPVPPGDYAGPQYTITGSVADLTECYIADRVTAKPGATQKNNLLYDYKSTIQFNFRSLGSKVRLGLYETIPGYSVENVVFYSGATSKTVPTLTAATACLPDATKNGTMTVTFPTETESASDYNKAHVSFAQAGGATPTDLVSFTAFASSEFVNREKLEIDNDATLQFIGRTSSDATTTEYLTVLPYETGTALTLKVDYTLRSKDGSGETITVHGATATVPVEYCKWQPNYAYTYIFKISDNTNGKTDVSQTTDGLYPITFDAIVTAAEDGVQETITEVATPALTTYAKGVNPTVAATAEYKTGVNIYVTANGVVALSGSNSKLYKVTVEDGAAQGITEASVANALVNGTKDNETTPTTWTVTDAKGKKLVVTTTSVPALSFPGEIAAGDAPTGNAISGNFAKFTPSAAGIYVFEYSNAGTKAYKVIKVVTA